MFDPASDFAARLGLSFDDTPAEAPAESYLDELLDPDPGTWTPEKARARARLFGELAKQRGQVEVEDPGWRRLAGAALSDAVAGPVVGLAGRVGLMDEDDSAFLREQIRDDLEETRVNYLAANPGKGRAIGGFLTELGAQTVPYLPTGGIGKGASMLATRLAPTTFRYTSRLSGAVAGAAAGGVEGALTGYGDSIGQDAAGTRAAVLQGALFGGALGGLGGSVGRAGGKNADRLWSGLEAAAGGDARAANAAIELVDAAAQHAGLHLDDFAERHFDLGTDPTKRRSQAAVSVTKGLSFLEDGRAVLHALEEGTPSTLLQDLGSVFRRNVLRPDELAAVERWAGVKEGDWTPAAEQKFAQAFERYAASDRAPNRKLRSAFASFRHWMADMELRFGHRGDVHVSADIQQAFDSLLRPPLTRDAKRTARQTGRSERASLDKQRRARRAGEQLKKAETFDDYMTSGADLPVPTFWDKVRRFTKDLERELFNNQAPLFRLADAAEDDLLPLLVAMDRGSGEMSRGPIHSATRLYNPETQQFEVTGDSFKAVVEELREPEVDDLNKLLGAERQLELHERPDFDTEQRTTDLANNALAELKHKYGADYGRLEKKAEELRGWSVRAILDPLLEVGVLSRDRYDAAIVDNQKYAPFIRILEELDPDGTAFHVRSQGGEANPLPKITKDISAGILRPMEGWLLRAQQVQRFVSRQRVRNQVAKLADENADLFSDFVRPVAGSKKKAPGEIAVYRDGQRSQYQATAELLEAVDGLGPRNVSMVMKGLAGPARMLRAGATLGLGFIARNPLRDQWTAWTYSKYGYNPVDFVRGLWYAANRDVLPYFDEYLASGAGMSSMVSVDRATTAKTLSDFTFKDTAASKKWRRQVASYLREPLKPLRALSETAELGTRLGAFVKARKAGATHLEAMAEARSITLDFGQAGSLGREYNKIEAFANAEAQDLYRFRQALQERPLATSAKAVANVTLPALSNYYYWHHLADREDQDAYQRLPEWDRMAFYHLGRTKSGGFIRLPRPVGVLNLIFGLAPEKAVAAFMDDDPDAGSELLTALVEQTPLHYGIQTRPTGDGGVRVVPSTDALPTAAEPWFEIASNYDPFKDAPVVPMSEQGELHETQGSVSMSPTVQAIARATHLSPYSVEHLIRGYGATVGSYAVGAADAAMRATGSAPERPLPRRDRALGGLGLVSRNPIGFSTQPVADFYALADLAAKSTKSSRTHRESGNSDAYLRLVREHPEIRFNRILQRHQSRLSKWRQDRQQVLGSDLDPLTKEELVLSLDQLVTTSTGSLMHAVADAMRSQEDQG